MIMAIPLIWPDWAALKLRVSAVMDVILHIGAHRTGTTTFQDYMRSNATGLKTRDICFWGPRRTRNGLFSGLLQGPVVATGRNRERRAIGRVKMHCLHTEQRGCRHLVISDENMIGSVRRNLRDASLYGGVGQRLARYAQAFEGRKINVFMSIRALDRYWVSAASYAISRGERTDDPALFEKLAKSTRSWRDVITDIACAFADASITILPFETFGGQPDAQLALMTGAQAPQTHARRRLNQSPNPTELRALLKENGQSSHFLCAAQRWQPFNTAQITTLRETYLDDLFWLHSGAEGLATIIEEKHIFRTGKNPAVVWNARGHQDDNEERKMV